MDAGRRRGFDPLGLFGSSSCLHLLPETRSQTRTAPVGLARVHSSIVRDLLSCGACARHGNELVMCSLCCILAKGSHLGGPCMDGSRASCTECPRSTAP